MQLGAWQIALLITASAAGGYAAKNIIEAIRRATGRRGE